MDDTRLLPYANYLLLRSFFPLHFSTLIWKWNSKCSSSMSRKGRRSPGSSVFLPELSLSVDPEPERTGTLAECMNQAARGAPSGTEEASACRGIRLWQRRMHFRENGPRGMRCSEGGSEKSGLSLREWCLIHSLILAGALSLTQTRGRGRALSRGWSTCKPGQPAPAPSSPPASSLLNPCMLGALTLPALAGIDHK